jgi:hypothetical protein
MHYRFTKHALLIHKSIQDPIHKPSSPSPEQPSRQNYTSSMVATRYSRTSACTFNNTFLFYCYRRRNQQPTFVPYFANDKASSSLEFPPDEKYFRASGARMESTVCRVNDRNLESPSRSCRRERDWRWHGLHIRG